MAVWIFVEDFWRELLNRKLAPISLNMGWMEPAVGFRNPSPPLNPQNTKKDLLVHFNTKDVKL
jgi:hypothetical protein